MCTHSWKVCVWLLGWAGQQSRGGVGGEEGGMRSTAPYCQPAVAAYEALLTVPSKSHLLTHTYSKMRTEGNLKQDTRTRVWVNVAFPGGLGLPRSLWSLPFFSLCSLSQVHALLLVSSLEDKRGGGGFKGRNKREGQKGAMCQNGEKLPCTMWPNPNTDIELNKKLQQCLSLNLFLQNDCLFG